MKAHAQSPTLTTAPASALLTLEEVKAHCRVDGADDDDLLTALIGAVTGYLDGYSGVLGRCLITQTWTQHLDDFPPSGRIALPLAPVSAVVVGYLDEAGDEQTFASSFYYLAQRAGTHFIELDEDATWPETADRPDAVRITMTCGYGGADAVPAAIRQAALVLVGHWYENREIAVIGAPVASVPMMVSALLAPYRRVGF